MPTDLSNLPIKPTMNTEISLFSLSLFSPGYTCPALNSFHRNSTSETQWSNTTEEGQVKIGKNPTHKQQILRSGLYCAELPPLHSFALSHDPGTSGIITRVTKK